MRRLTIFTGVADRIRKIRNLMAFWIRTLQYLSETGGNFKQQERPAIFFLRFWSFCLLLFFILSMLKSNVRVGY
jgi:hypothetical protein